MKKSIMTLLVAFSVGLNYAQTFQGEFIYEFSIQNAPDMGMQYRTITDGKNTKSVVNMMGQEMEVIRYDENYLYVIMHAQKMIIKSKNDNSMLNNPNSMFQDVTCKPEQSQKKRNILGYDCSEYRAVCTDKEGETSIVSVWYTEAISLPMVQYQPSSFGIQDLPQEGAAMEMTITRNGEALMNMKVAKISPRVVAASEFEIPKNYQLLEY